MTFTCDTLLDCSGHITDSSYQAKHSSQHPTLPKPPLGDATSRCDDQASTNRPPLHWKSPSTSRCTEEATSNDFFSFGLSADCEQASSAMINHRSLRGGSVRSVHTCSEEIRGKEKQLTPRIERFSNCPVLFVAFISILCHSIVDRSCHRRRVFSPMSFSRYHATNTSTIIFLCFSLYFFLLCT